MSWDWFRGELVARNCNDLPGSFLPEEGRRASSAGSWEEAWWEEDMYAADGEQVTSLSLAESGINSVRSKKLCLQ